MTVIVGLVHDGAAWLGADSRGVDVNGRAVSRNKLIAVEFDDGSTALLGWSGDSRTNHHMRRKLQVDQPDSDLDVWASNTAARIAHLHLYAQPPILDSDGGAEGHGLLAYAGRLWRMEQDAAHPLRGGVYAVGSGSDYALGALYALTVQEPYARLSLPPHHAVTLALKAACAWQADCAEPLDVREARAARTPTTEVEA